MPDDDERRAWFRREVLPLEPELRAYAKRYCRAGRGEVDDLVNEVFVRIIAYDSWRALENPVAFARRILRNVALDVVRRTKIVEIQVVADLDELGAVDDSPSPEATTVSRDEIRQLQLIVEKLPRQARRVFTLKKVYNLDTEAIAEELGLSVSTVEKHLTRALRRCAEELGRANRGNLVNEPRRQLRQSPDRTNLR